MKSNRVLTDGEDIGNVACRLSTGSPDEAFGLTLGQRILRRALLNSFLPSPEHRFMKVY